MVSTENILNFAFNLANAKDYQSDLFQVVEFEATEEISDGYHVSITLCVENSRCDDVNTQTLLEQNATLEIHSKEQGNRQFTDFIAHAEYLETGQHYSQYLITLKPESWRLRFRQDARIFQSLTAPQIIAQICAEHNLRDIEIHLTQEYAEY